MQSTGLSPSAENYSILTISQKLYAKTPKYVNKKKKTKKKIQEHCDRMLKWTAVSKIEWPQTCKI